jgi:lipopolysaccharide/colanic/teichoic acid biosynthesis glycosyltransferase
VSLRANEQVSKRLFDLLVSAVGLVVLSPLFVVLAIWIKLDSPGPVFYRGRRVGKDGLLFDMLKFRGMVVGAHEEGPGITAKGDPRITRAGRFLRQSKLDEVPQLINVLLGEMSLVGPRPEDPRYVELYTPEQRRVLGVRPGITSLASIKFRHEELLLAQGGGDDFYVQELMPRKLDIDLAYLERATFWSDLQVLWMTAGAVLTTSTDKDVA